MDIDEFLAHNGVKGMHWGVRKAHPEPIVRPRDGKAMDLKPNADGSIYIPKGATIQRVVNHGKTLGSSAGTDLGKNVTYAAFTKGDRLRYETAFGYTKNLFVKENSQVLTLTAQVPLKAPTPSKTSTLYFENLKKNPEQLNQVRSHLKRSGLYSDNGFQKILQDPTSKNAYSLFGSLYDSGNYSSKLAPINTSFHNSLKKSGFNMILDPSDSTFGGMYDAPVAVLDGAKNLHVTGRDVVTKASRKSANQALHEYDKIDKGKKLMQRLGYDS